MQEVAQCEEDRSAADGEDDGRLALGTEIANHVHVLLLRLVVDLWRRRRSTGLGPHRYQRGHLDHRVVRCVEERHKVERFVVRDQRVALAANVEHVGDFVLPGGQRAVFFEELARRCLRLAKGRIVLVDADISLGQEFFSDELLQFARIGVFVAVR